MQTSVLALAVFFLSLAPLRFVSAASTMEIDPDHPASVQAGIEAAAAAGLAKVVVPAGVYHLTPKDGWHLRFKGLHDLEIDATGATFVLADPHVNGIGFIDCHNVTFRGARVERSRPADSQATVRAIDPVGEFVDLQIDKGYPDQLLDPKEFPTFWAGLFTPEGELIGGMRAKTPPQIERLDSGFFRVHLYDTIPKIETSLGLKVVPGMRLAWRGPVCDDIRSGNCEAMKFIYITVAGGSGMVFHEMGGKGGNEYLRCQVTYPPKPTGAEAAPLFATCADGLHSHDVMKGPLVDHCLFEGVDDDCIAIHGTYAMVAEAKGTRLVAWVFRETRDQLYCHPGETLRFYDPKGILVGESTVVSVRPLPGYRPAFQPDSVYRAFQDPAKDAFVELTLDHSAPTLLPGSLVSNADRSGNGYVIRDCIIRNSTARGVMAKGSNGLIEGCTFENLGRAGVEFMSEMEVWSEADYSHDVVIRNNIFRNVSKNRYAGYLRHPGAVTIFNFRAKTANPDLTLRQGTYVPQPGGHRNITIEGNLFDRVDGPNLIVTSAKNVIIRNNRFVHPMQNDKVLGAEKGIDTNALLWFTESTGLALSGNEVTDPGPFLKHLVTATASASGTGFDTGFETTTTTKN